jgi:hypothetical protein
MAYRSGQYRPTEEIAFEVIEAAYKKLPEEDAAIIRRNMKAVDRGLIETKIAKQTELLGQPPKGVKLQFGEKSNLELMARLGIYFRKMEDEDPEAWKQLLAWAESRD